MKLISVALILGGAVMAAQGGVISSSGMMGSDGKVRRDVAGDVEEENQEVIPVSGGLNSVRDHIPVDHFVEYERPGFSSCDLADYESNCCRNKKYCDEHKLWRPDCHYICPPAKLSGPVNWHAVRWPHATAAAALSPPTQTENTVEISRRKLPWWDMCPTITGMCKLHKDWPAECAYVCNNIRKPKPPHPRQNIPSLPMPTDYCSTVVYQTNLHRMNHSAPLVTYNQTLAGSVGWEMLDCPASPIEIIGSNYAAYWGTGPDPHDPASATVQAIHDWYETEQVVYAEASNDYTTSPALPPSLSSTFNQWGHFSNMVWESSTQIGCWSLSCGSDTAFAQQFGDVDWSWIVMCVNSPPGNSGDYTDNVKPPIGLPPSDYSIQNDSPCY